VDKPCNYSVFSERLTVVIDSSITFHKSTMVLCAQLKISVKSKAKSNISVHFYITNAIFVM